MKTDIDWLMKETHPACITSTLWNIEVHFDDHDVQADEKMNFILSEN